MPNPVTESVTLTEATTTAEGGVLEVEFITPGWGSSGYYSREVVEAAAPLFAVGTHMYLDHPTAEEDAARPVRSVKDLAAVITESGSVDPATGGVRGKVRPLAPYRELLTDEAFATNIGLSIRGSATDITIGEAEGRRGPIVEGLADIASVDFVTRAGRGGRVLAVLESATSEEVTARAIAQGVEEATADERRQQLSDVVRTAYAGEDRYAWVQDFDDSTVWFQASAENERSRTWEQTYEVAADDMSVALTGVRAEVRQVTRYVPIGSTEPLIVSATRPDSTTTESLKEDIMPKIEIEEAEHTRLVENDGRVTTLESERDTAVTERDAARAELAGERRRNRAMDLVREHAHRFSALEARGLVAELPLTEAGEFDEAAFTTQLDEHAATVEAAGGAGTVHGFGSSTEGNSTTEATKPTTTAWGRSLTEQKGA